MEETSGKWKELLEVLDHFASGALGTVDASRRISHFRSTLDETENPLFFPFLAHDSESDHFPLGQFRERWSDSALAREDATRMELEALARPRLLEAAKDLRAYVEKHAI